MTEPFTAPGNAGSGITWADHKGALLLIAVHAVESGIKTAYGDSDAIRADVVVLEGDDVVAEYRDCLIFPRLLQSQLRSRVGQRVLARLGQGAAKPGQSPPWLFEDASAADEQTGRRHLSRQLTTAAAPF